MFNCKIRSILITAMIFMAVFTISATAQGNGGGGNGKGKGGGFNNGNSYFNPESVASFSGTLVDSYQDWVPSGNGNHTGGGTHFRLKANDGSLYELMLGSYVFMTDQGLSLNVGDSVSVAGSLVDPYLSNFTEYKYIIVTVINGVTLRDADGYPVWGGSKNGGRGTGSNAGNSYFDPATVASFSGTLSESLGLFLNSGSGNYTGNGMHYIFTASNGTKYYTMFGPYWFMENAGIALEEGMSLSISGSVVEPYYSQYSDYSYIIVSEITVGGNNVIIRDVNGYPLWSGTGGHYFDRGYDKQNKGTVSGTVTSVRTRTNGANLDDGYELRIRSGNKRYTLYVAPEYYCEQLGFSVANGDSIKATGSIDGKGIVVRNIKTSRKNYNFRTANGKPCWEAGPAN